MNETSQPTSEARSATDRAFSIYQRLVAFSLILLTAATYPLWVNISDFPAVPFFGALCDVPGVVDIVGFSVMLLAAIALLAIGPKSSYASILWLTIATSLLLCFLLNQHRFQPWAYQFAVLSLFFGLAPAKLARKLAIGVTLSIYFYSALSKLNPSFVYELGSDFLVTLASFTGQSLTPQELGPWKWLALAFPAFELAAFVLLLMPRTRRLGMVAACLMHVGLLLVLGPLGLSHSLGVLLWNLFFIAQAILLFAFEPAADAEEKPVPSTIGTRLAQLVCLTVILFPTLELIGLGDPWPAWGLYASHVGRSHLFLSRHAVATLPEDLQPYVDVEESEDLFVPVHLEQWSFDRTGAPLYPGQRFAVATARAFVAKTNTAAAARIVLESPAGRFQDERDAEAFAADKVPMESDRRFWLNTRARSAFFDQP